MKTDLTNKMKTSQMRSLISIRVCPSVGPSVDPSVRPSVRPSIRRSHASWIHVLVPFFTKIEIKAQKAIRICLLSVLFFNLVTWWGLYCPLPFVFFWNINVHHLLSKLCLTYIFSVRINSSKFWCLMLDVSCVRTSLC